jgi:hypothetical protein
VLWAGSSGPGVGEEPADRFGCFAVWGGFRLARFRRLDRGVCAAEEFLDALVGDFLLAVDAFGVDAQEDLDTVAGPLGDLGGSDAAVEPEGDCGVPEVVGAAGERRGDLVWSQGQEAGLLPDLGVGGGADGLASFGAEQAAVGGGAEFLDVRLEDVYQNWRDWYDADVVVGAVLEAAFAVGLAGVGPASVDLGP